MPNQLFVARGRRIHATRKRQGLTQKQIADAAGNSKDTLQRYEQGKATPGGDTLVRIADALSVDARWLLNGRASIEQEQED